LGQTAGGFETATTEHIFSLCSYPEGRVICSLEWQQNSSPRRQQRRVSNKCTGAFCDSTVYPWFLYLGGRCL